TESHRRTNEDDAEYGAEAAGGKANRHVAAQPNPGHGTDEDGASQGVVHVSRDDVRDAAGPKHDRRVEDVGAYHLVRAQPEEQDQAQRDERSASRRGNPQYEADRETQQHRSNLVPRLHLDVIPLAGDELFEENRADQSERTGEGDRTGQQQEHRVIELGTPKTLPQHTDDIYAEDRGRHR